MSDPFGLMLKPGTREKPSAFICSRCGQAVRLTLHRDFLEGSCCNAIYTVREGENIWNCCSVGFNSPGGRGDEIADEMEQDQATTSPLRDTRTLKATVTHVSPDEKEDTDA